MAGAVIAIFAGLQRLIDYVQQIGHHTTTAYSQSSASAEFKLDVNGQYYGSASLGTWCTDASKVGLYEVYATKTAGSNVYGQVGSWVSLDVARTWGLTANATTVDTTLTATVNIQVRRKGTTTVLLYSDVSFQSTATVGGTGGV